MYTNTNYASLLKSINDFPLLNHAEHQEWNVTGDNIKNRKYQIGIEHNYSIFPSND